MASQPPDTGRDRNQVRPLRSTVSSVRGKANRHRSTGVLGSHFVLDCGGSREQAARFQDLLQQPSHPYLNGRANAESTCVTTNRKSPFVSMATALSILISDTSGRVIFRRLSIALVSGQPWEDFQLIKSFGACILGCCALRESDRFTPTVSIRQRQAAKARLCCVRFVSRYFSCSINILRLTANNSGASFRRLSKEAADGFL